MDRKSVPRLSDTEKYEAHQQSSIPALPRSMAASGFPFRYWRIRRARPAPTASANRHLALDAPIRVCAYKQHVRNVEPLATSKDECASAVKAIDNIRNRIVGPRLWTRQFSWHHLNSRCFIMFRVS